MSLPNQVMRKIILMQRHEMTELLLYKHLAARTKNPHDKEVLLEIAGQEQQHYEFCRDITGFDVKPLQPRLWLFLFLTRIFGTHFSLRLMEATEISVGSIYKELVPHHPGFKKILRDEEGHEKKLLDLLSKHNLIYTSSVVLGLNDALVEMIGALAGLTFAFQNSQIIAAASLITGSAASLSMAVSEYLSTKEDNDESKDPLRASFFTGGAYLFAVILVITPFLLTTNPHLALFISVLVVVALIAVFNFYISVARNRSFKRSFLQMLMLSLGTAFVIYLVGALVRAYFKVEI